MSMRRAIRKTAHGAVSTAPENALSSSFQLTGGDGMTKHLALAVTIAWLAAGAAPAMAETKAATTAGEGKKVSAQQQRMKDCAAKWKDEKKAKNVKGRDAYRSFMSGCLKG